MKKIFSLILLFCFLTVFSQKLVWKEGTKLNWSLFKSSENKMKSDSTIVSYSSCGLSYTAFKDKANNKMKVRIDATFDPSKSWKHPIKTKNLNINHEQGHFDIAEIYARKLRKEFLENVNYDSITKRGTNAEKQNELDAEIKAQLKKLERYKN